MKKKNVLALLLLALAVLPSAAQKFALVDMEYILKNIPAYERANEQLNQTSKKWQSEVEVLNKQAKTLYDNYQNESVFTAAFVEDARKLRRRIYAAVGAIRFVDITAEARFPPWE